MLRAWTEHRKPPVAARPLAALPAGLRYVVETGPAEAFTEAKALMAENIPARVWMLYPARKYTFLSQVEGGMTANKTCVVSARVMLLPLTATVGAVLMRPQKTATAFDAQPDSSTEQCRSLARDKLKEATAAVGAALGK